MDNRHRLMCIYPFRLDCILRGMFDLDWNEMIEWLERTSKGNVLSNTYYLLYRLIQSNQKNTSHCKRNSLFIFISASHVHNLQWIFFYLHFPYRWYFCHDFCARIKSLLFFFFPLLSFQLRFLNEIHLMYWRKWDCIHVHGTSWQELFIHYRKQMRIWNQKVRVCVCALVKIAYTSLCRRCRRQPSAVTWVKEKPYWKMF